MTIVVPYDATDLSNAALERATEYSESGEDVRAVTVIPDGNSDYARNRGWLTDGESFDPETIVSRLSNEVTDTAPGATFDYIVVGRYAPSGKIAREIRSYAEDHDARLIAIGSDNAGRLVTTVSSVGGAVASNLAYDVLIVRPSR